jgi:BirA family biotin operon repressor/biotin-[acetyl-CoA-carboxylase] ligase
VGSLALSIVLYPDLHLLPSLIMLAPLAALRSITTVASIKPQIKWPNDLLIRERKVCGVLIENQMRGTNVDYTIIGIGINVNIHLADFPEISPIATSISDEIGKEVSMKKLAQQLFIEFEKIYMAARQGILPYEEWRDNMVILGREVTVSSEDVIYSGIAESVAPDGSLLLRLPDGSRSNIVTGDASLTIKKS